MNKNTWAKTDAFENLPRQFQSHRSKKSKTDFVCHFVATDETYTYTELNCEEKFTKLDKF